MARPALERFIQSDMSRPERYRDTGDDDPLETDEQYVGMVRKSYDDWYRLRYAYEPGWWLCLSYYMGYQYHGWSEVERILRESRAPSYRVRFVINRIMPMIKLFLGKLLSGDPMFKCRPAEPSQTAFVDARVADKLLKGLFRELRMRDIMQEFLAWCLITGHAFMKIGWDPTLGEEIGGEILAEMGMEPVRVGDIHVQAMGPFSILVPPEQATLWRPSSIIEARIYPLEYVKSIYGERARGLKPDADLNKMSNYESRLSTLVSPNGYQAINSKDLAHNSTYVIERWDDPQVLTEEERQKFPRGRVVTICQDRLLLLEENPWKEGGHPFVDCRAEILPGRFWGATLVDQMIPLQKSYNRSRSQMVEARNLACNPVLDVEKGHGIVKMTTEPGAIAERNRGFKEPAWRVPPMMPPHLAQDIQQTMNDWEEVSQQRQSSKGQAPAANISGVGINLLQEADNTPMGPLAIRIAESYGRIGDKLVNRAQQFYNEERVFGITGEGDELEVITFLGDKHQSKLRVECVVDSILPESRAARMARVQEAIQMGALNPQADRSAIIRMLEFGNVEQLWEQVDLDRAKQRREMKQLLAGQPVMINTFDDHTVHLDEVNRYRKSIEYDTMDPMIKQLLDQHAMAHEQAVAVMAQAAGLAGGGVPLPGSPVGGENLPFPQPPALGPMGGENAT